MAVEFGMTLSSEEHAPEDLVGLAVDAERSGFDFVSISDHYHPWIDAQGHAGFVWAVLGAIAQATDAIEVAVGVTCPTTRIHPAILAQATATTARLLSGRFVWGVGSGEALNEQILGDPWPPADVRIDMLEEAIEVVRKLWQGDTVTHRGRHYTVEDARIYDPPPGEVPIVVSAFGPEAAEMAARAGDGLWVTGADPKSISVFAEAGGTGPVYSQLGVCWAATVEEAVDTAHRVWPNTRVPGSTQPGPADPGALRAGCGDRHPRDGRRRRPVRTRPWTGDRRHRRGRRRRRRSRVPPPDRPGPGRIPQVLERRPRPRGGSPPQAGLSAGASSHGRFAGRQQGEAVTGDR